jgi:hypothetical protein
MELMRNTLVLSHTVTLQQPMKRCTFAVAVKPATNPGATAATTAEVL